VKKLRKWNKLLKCFLCKFSLNPNKLTRVPSFINLKCNYNCLLVEGFKSFKNSSQKYFLTNLVLGLFTKLKISKFIYRSNKRRSFYEIKQTRPIDLTRVCCLKIYNYFSGFNREIREEHTVLFPIPIRTHVLPSSPPYFQRSQFTRLKDKPNWSQCE